MTDDGDDCNYRLLVVAMDSLGAMAAEPRDLLLEAYKARREAARSDLEKWALAYELQNFTEKLNACVQRGNVTILMEQAEPLATGFGPAARLPERMGEPEDYVSWDD